MQSWMCSKTGDPYSKARRCFFYCGSSRKQCNRKLFDDNDKSLMSTARSIRGPSSLVGVHLTLDLNEHYLRLVHSSC
jgi:hypothetical protein